MDMNAIMAAYGGDAASIQQRIVYRDIGGNDDKQNNSVMEELRNKENLLRIEQ